MFDLEGATRQARVLEHLEHRPWPVPERRWLMGQTWSDLLFAHWRVPRETLRDHVPPELELEEHDGSAWLGITPFRVSGVRLRGMLPVPGLSSFLEVNVRTFVRAADGTPGVWFFSLDASSRAAVEFARRVYRLPYVQARIATEQLGPWLDVECARTGERGRVFSGRYRPDDEAFHAEPGSLEWFLTERYCLYTTDATGALYRAEIHHDLWPLQVAEADIELATIAPFRLTGAPIYHFSKRQDVVIWPLDRVR